MNGYSVRSHLLSRHPYFRCVWNFNATQQLSPWRGCSACCGYSRVKFDSVHINVLQSCKSCHAIAANMHTATAYALFKWTKKTSCSGQLMTIIIISFSLLKWNLNMDLINILRWRKSFQIFNKIISPVMFFNSATWCKSSRSTEKAFSADRFVIFWWSDLPDTFTYFIHRERMMY